MPKLPDKQIFELSKNGYLKYCGGHTGESVYYGAIVCHTINKWFGLPETSQYLKDAPDRIKKLKEAMQRATASAHCKYPYMLELKDPRLKNILKLVTDRDNYALEYGSLTAHFDSTAIEVRLYWDSAKKQVKQRLYVDDVDDLLLYDIGKVLELGIVIRQCPVCGRYFVVGKGGRKYCSEHSKEGANKARYKNRIADERKAIHQRVCNRIRAAKYGYGDVNDTIKTFNSQYSAIIALETSGKKTADETLVALRELDDKYRQRKKRDKSGTTPGEVPL